LIQSQPPAGQSRPISNPMAPRRLSWYVISDSFWHIVLQNSPRILYVIKVPICFNCVFEYW
jgi:hypothetical protein